MDLGDPNQSRLIGDYRLGPRIGSGSFAVVWRSRHRHSGMEVAVKEIDKKQLNHRNSLLKEISILAHIRHPNIIRLFEAIETEDRIYIVLEYCDGGDLAAYIHRHGKVSQAVATHFMRQLAAGLRVLCENNLIHRDLKPQNLLLSTNEATPLLKIGDFGFARYLTPQGLAETLCGSPLYMAPEIIKNQKYDAKADLWSVGAILFQLVTGKPPFHGDSQLQLFQNILASGELRFPQGALEELHPDCVGLCRSLLRQNPVERLTFEEFFNHKFLAEPRLTVDVEQSSPLPQIKSLVEQLECLTEELPPASDKRPQLSSGHPLNSSNRNPKLTCTSVYDDNNKILRRKDHGSTSSSKGAHGYMPNTPWRKSVDGDLNSSDHLIVADSLESIEKEYVLVNAHFASIETISSSLETSLQDNSASRVSIGPPKKNDQDIVVAMQTKELAACSVGGAESPGSHGSDPLAASCASTILREVQGLSILHPSARLQLLHQYIHTFSELAQEKFNAGSFLESFSVELVVLAIWKEALRVCSSWLASTAEGDLPGSCSASETIPVQEGAGLSPNSEENIDFSRPSSVTMWAERGFIVAFDRAEMLSNHLQDMEGNTEMPDAMEIIFQTALAVGKSGAVDERMENKGSAAASYSKAMLMLSFIVGEAMSLPLNPPFSLTPADKWRIQRYIINLQSHQTRCQMSQLSPKKSRHSLTK